MFVNTAGSIIELKVGVDYSPKWINTSPRLKDSAAASGTGPGYWIPPITALHIVSSTATTTFYTLKSNMNIRSPYLNKPLLLDGGILSGKKYFYSIAATDDGSHWAYPSKQNVITFYDPNKKTVKLKWLPIIGATKYKIFRSTVYGVLQEMHETADASITELIDDGSHIWDANTVINFGIPVIIGAGGLLAGHVYNIYVRKFTALGGTILGYRPPNMPTDISG